MVSVLKYSVGIDVSKKTLQVCLSGIESDQNVRVKATSSFDNTKGGLQKLMTWITKHTKKDSSIPKTVTMEATGVYHELSAWYLYSRQIKVSVVLPNIAKRFFESMNLKSKNDYLDAKGLAQMGAERNLDSWEPISEDVAGLRAWTRHYETLQESLTQSRNRLEAETHSEYRIAEVEAATLEQIAFFKKQCTTAVKSLLKLVKEDEKLHELSKLLSSVKGVGELTAAVVIAETNGFLNIANESQLISYAGYDVVEHQSGKRAGKTKISKKGNSHIRRGMHMPSLILVSRQVQPFYDLYLRVFAKTGIKMKAYVAVQRKLLSILFALAKNKKKFDPNYVSNWQNTKVVENSEEITLREERGGGFLSATSSAGLVVASC